jgi:hypothetical protein
MLAILPAANASVIDLSTPTGDLGVTHTYASGSSSVTATAFGPGAPDLVGVLSGPDDQGLGLSNSPFPGDKEITSGSFVQFSFAGVSTVNFLASSLLPSDTGAWYGSNTAGSLGTQLLTFAAETPIDLTAYVAQFAFLDLTALPPELQPVGSNGSILANSFTVTAGGSPVPEPNSLALLVIGIGLTLVGLNRRRIRQNGLGCV